MANTANWSGWIVETVVENLNVILAAYPRIATVVEMHGALIPLSLVFLKYKIHYMLEKHLILIIMLNTILAQIESRYDPFSIQSFDPLLD